jgi:hypothetical protein
LTVSRPSAFNRPLVSAGGKAFYEHKIGTCNVKPALDIVVR